MKYQLIFRKIDLAQTPPGSKAVRNPPRPIRMYAGRGLISLHNKAAGSQIKTGGFVKLIHN
jgi:hypothetical protein